jgi:hypothetical protein
VDILSPQVIFVTKCDSGIITEESSTAKIRLKSENQGAMNREGKSETGR